MTKRSVSPPATSIRPEAELLLCCARTCMDTEGAARVRILLRAELDWAYLLQTAFRHGALALLYWNLNTTCPDDVPEDALELLRGYFHANDLHNQVLTEELLTLLTRFEVHGIPAVPFKGPLLAAAVYGNLSLRQFRDIDILVRQPDFQHAWDLLISQGYRPRIPLSEKHDVAHAHARRTRGFVRHSDRGEIIVDLQWGVTALPDFSVPVTGERFWEGLECVSLSGTMVRSIPPPALLQILCVHGSRHGWGRLLWICDVAELLRTHPEMDWGQVIEQARTQGHKRMLFLGLALARTLLGIALPEAVLQGMQADARLRSLTAQVCARLFSEAALPRRDWERHVFSLKVKERWQDRVRYVLRGSVSRVRGLVYRGALK